MNTKPKTTITKTTKGVTEFVEHSTDVQLMPMPNGGRPYVLESSEFDAFILGKQRAAQREIDDLDVEIARLQAEIESRYHRRADLVAIVDKASAALNVGTDHIPRFEPRHITTGESPAT